MPYTPNFADPRVQRRIVNAIAFVQQHVRQSRSQPLGTRYIDSVFSSQRRPLGKYLRQQLLICSDERYNKDLKITKRYRLNAPGLAELEQQLSQYKQQTVTYSVAEVVDQFQQELNSGIEYNDSSDRKWHWLQNHQRESKQLVLKHSGLCHNYDITSACVTLLHQYSSQIPEIVTDGQWQQGPMDLYLFAVRDLLNNKTAIRSQLAQDADVSVITIKRLIAGMFQGGYISANRRTSSYELLDGDVARIKFLQQHPFVQALAADIRIIWQYIKPTLYKTTSVDKNRVVRTCAISGKQKTALYRDLERRVREPIEMYLKQTRNQFYLEHDGWACADQVDTSSLRTFVKQHSGFDIDLDYQCL